jgi:DNA primase
MNTQRNRIDEAIQYHEALPRRIREYLNARGIADWIIDSHLLGWNGWRITVPIYNRLGSVVFFRLAKDPQDSLPSPKMLTSPGATVELYGWERLLEPASRIVVCEGEFDRLVLEGQGFPAVTSTAGAVCFRPAWAEHLKEIEEVYVCFDRDQAGANGAMVVGTMVPHAKRVQLPDEVGEGGDVTDFFVQLGKGKDDFLRLLEAATPIPASAVPAQRTSRSTGAQPLSSLLGSRLERIKRELPIDVFIGKSVQLKSTAIGATLIGRCPFHDDRTPSFTVYPRSGTYHCFGCRAHGDVIRFTQAIQQVGFGEAVEMLEQMIPHYGKPPGENKQQDKAA